MGHEYWVDGFNFFHQWEATRESFSSGQDIVQTVERALRLFSRFLGPKARFTCVFLDGGLSRQEIRFGMLKVRYCGPGRKADDRMTEDLRDIGERARDVMAVSNDRELKAGMRLFGATCLGVNEFLAHLQPKRDGGGVRGGKKGKNPGKADRIIKEKFKVLSAAEIAAWLELFGGEPEEPPPGRDGKRR